MGARVGPRSSAAARASCQRQAAARVRPAQPVAAQAHASTAALHAAARPTVVTSWMSRPTNECMESVRLVWMEAEEAAREEGRSWSGGPPPPPPPADRALAGPLPAASTSRCGGTLTRSVSRSAAASCSASIFCPGWPACCACACCACCCSGPAAAAAPAAASASARCSEPVGVSCLGVAALPRVVTSCR